MVFSSTIFLFLFLPITLCTYYLLRDEYRNAFLLCASLLFYFWGEGKYVGILILYIIVNFLIGLAIETCVGQHNSRGKRAKLLVATAITFNLGLLVFFKYAGFIIENINRFAFLGFEPIVFHASHLPIGISFFHFRPFHI